MPVFGTGFAYTIPKPNKTSYECSEFLLFSPVCPRYQ